MQHPPKKQRKKRPGRKWLMAGLVMALLLAVGFIWLIPQITAAFPSKAKVIFTEAVQPKTFAIIPADTLESVMVFPGDGSSYLLGMKDGKLQLQRGEEWLDINDVYAAELLRAVTQIVAQDVVAEDAAEVSQHLEEMGLQTPRASARIRYTDGREETLSIGADVPNTTYAYCRWSGNAAVYLCDAGVVEALTLTEKRLLPVEQPLIYAGLLDKLSITNGHGLCEMVFGTTAQMIQPYVYPLAADQMNGLLTALENFRLGVLEADVTGENRAFYGFDNPLCTVEVLQSAGVTSAVEESGELATRWMQAQAYRFTIGRTEGDYFYTCEYEGKCYLISRFLAEALVNARAEELLSRAPADLDGLALRTLQLQTPSGSAQVNITRTERVLPNNELEVDAQGNVVYDTAVTINGREAAAEWKDELVSRLNALRVSGNAPAGWQAQGTPRWSLVLETENGLVRTVEAYRLDLFTDVIAVDGTALHCVNSEAMDLISEGLI